MWAVKCKFLNKVRLYCWDWYRAFKQFLLNIPVKYCWGYLTHLSSFRSLLKGFIILFYLLTVGLRPSCFQYFCLILSVIGCWLNNLVCYWLLDLINMSAFACCLFNNRVYFVSAFVCLIILSTSVCYIYFPPRKLRPRNLKRHGSNTNQAAPRKPPLKGSRKEKPAGDRTKPR